MAKADKDRKVLWNYMGKTTAQYRWTDTAIMCHKRGCKCKGCFYENFFSDKNQKCQMKAAVLELVRKIGLPPEKEDKLKDDTDN